MVYYDCVIIIEKGRSRPKREFIMRLDKIDLYKLGGLAAFIVLLYWGLENTGTVLSLLGGVYKLFAPIVIGGCIAFILNVPMRFIESRLLSGMTGRAARFKRPLGVLLALLLVAGVVFIVMFLLVPELKNTVELISTGAPRYIEQLNGQMNALTAALPADLAEWLSGFRLDWNTIMAASLDFFKNDGSAFLNSTIGAVGSVVGGVVTGFLGFVFSLYILMQKETLCRQTRRLTYAFLPERQADRLVRVASLSNRTFSSFLSGQCAEAFILGAMFFLAMTVLRFPYALLVGVLVGFTAIIPIFGAFIGCGVGAFLILMVDPMQAVWFILLFLVLQQIEGNLIYPKVVGSSVGLPSIWVLLAVTIGGSAMGIVGMLVFIPLCSVVYTLLRESVGNRLARRKIDKDKL